MTLGSLDACASPLPVALRSGTRDGHGSLEVVARDGARINARIAPALELPGARVIRLDHGDRDPKGDYFLAAPWAPRPDLRGETAGLLRVGYCRSDESLCRSIALRVTIPPAATE
jgi:hypothetical protein